MQHVPGFNIASRRHFLESAGLGFGSVALTSLLHSEGLLADESNATNPLAPPHSHHRRRSRRSPQQGKPPRHHRHWGQVRFGRMPVHWGTFNLALHAWDEPVIHVQELMVSRSSALLAPLAGGTVDATQPHVAAAWVERWQSWRESDPDPSFMEAPS